MNTNKPVKFSGSSPIGKLLALPLRLGLLWTCLGGGFVIATCAAETPPLPLLAVASVSSDGIYLPQLFATTNPLPAVRLGDAPAFGKELAFTREQISSLLQAAVPSVGTNLTGSEGIKITRRTRTFGETDLINLLTSTLQQNYIKNRGQLELHLGQPWKAIILPDEPLSLDITELPSSGVTPGFIVRFTVRAGTETLGRWQANIKASVWREIWVASAQLQRGEPVNPDKMNRERRDILSSRDILAEFNDGFTDLEMAEPVPAGQPLLARMVKARTVVHRGQRVDAVIQEGAMNVRTKVEVLEDGAPGQTIRARNINSKRDLSGKVINEKTILISL